MAPCFWNVAQPAEFRMQISQKPVIGALSDVCSKSIKMRYQYQRARCQMSHSLIEIGLRVPSFENREHPNNERQAQ